MNKANHGVLARLEQKLKWDKWWMNEYNSGVKANGQDYYITLGSISALEYAIKEIKETV